MEVSAEAPVEVQATRLLLSLRRTSDPYEVYDRLRGLGPVLLVPALNSVVLSGYDVCRHVLRSAEFRVPDAAWRDQHIPGWRRSTAMEAYGTSLLNTNPPEHQAGRERFAPHLTRSVIDRLTTTVRELADDCVRGFAAALARYGVADAVPLLTVPLPARVLCALLGLPDRDAETVAGMMLRHQVVGELFPTQEGLAGADRVTGELATYFRRLREGTDPKAQPVWTQLTEVECLLLLQAGFSTTFALLSTALCELLKDDGALAADLTARPELIPDTVEGWLRYRPPAAVVSRITNRDAVLSGVSVPADTHLLVLIAAANRDPDGPGNLSFGLGAHYCLGAQLARMEAVALIQAILPHAVNWRLQSSSAVFVGHTMPQVRALDVTMKHPPSAGASDHTVDGPTAD